ncbi:LuxR C-terminal-related transcriptional regulator [Burkholderia multivorans]|nr:LuxR C-terminal-related transcriptional regulator [Burkholderia multivorans]
MFIFFDDFHLIEQPDVLALVSAILTSPLDRIHLIIAGRRKPDLPIPRLRAVEDIFELNAEDLAFSDTETKDFINTSTESNISHLQAERLREKTEGWVASLQMATIAIRTSGDIEDFLNAFSGADRNIEDFLMEEVIGHLPAELHEFLIATSILDKFNSDLADFVLQRQGSRTIIDRLESLNLFLLSLDHDRKWYRYHHLFAELLRKRLQERHPGVADTYHRRAADWLATRGMHTDAIEHAFSVGDDSRAGQLLDTTCSELFASAQTSILKSYASRLPSHIANALPKLQLELAWENCVQWRFAEARRELKHVHDLLASPSASETPDARQLTAADRLNLTAKLDHREVMLKIFTDDLEGVLRAGTNWLERFGQSDLFMAGSVATAMIVSRRENYDCELTLAESETIRQQFTEANASYGNVFLDTVVGATSFMRGDLPSAERSLRDARRLAERVRGERSTLAAMPGVQLAQVLYESDRLGEAHQLIQDFAEISPAFGVIDSVIARQLTMANLARTRNDLREAHTALDIATHIADRYHLPRVHAHVLAERIRLLVTDGQYREAERLTTSSRYAHGLRAISPSVQVDTTREQFAIAHVRLNSERGNVSDSISLLKRWIAWTRDRHCYRSSIRLLTLLTRLYIRANDILAARRALIDALHLGSHGPFIRSIVDEGPVIVEMLEDLLSNSSSLTAISADYVESLAHSAGIGTNAKRIAESALIPTGEQDSSLSEREIDILRLAARSLDTAEIAGALGLAESTVKWYWRKIFGKFGVHRRTAAIRLARQRGLIF